MTTSAPVYAPVPKPMAGNSMPGSAALCSGKDGMSRAAAHLAGDFGIPVSLGNTIMEIGVHLAASLPEVVYLEFSDLAWNKLAKEPVKFENSQAFAPERPGHGIELDHEALAEFSCPE